MLNSSATEEGDGDDGETKGLFIVRTWPNQLAG